MNERLEEIKKRMYYLLDLQKNKDIDWLIQQAERVEELEKENEEFKEINKANYWEGNTIKFENQRYKQALEDIRDITTGSAHQFAIQALAGDSDE